MSISRTDLGLEDEDLWRRIMITARRIAPCIDSFADESEDKKNAVAILKGAIAELPASGFGRATEFSRNGTSIKLSDIENAFSAQHRADLQSLCGSAPLGLPEGHFPTDRLFASLWPEEQYP